MSLYTAYLYLAGAIIMEVIATSFLKSSESFTRLLPSLITIGGYAASFFLLSIALRTMPTGVAYALWSGIGIVLISLIGWFWFGQALDGAALAGIGLIMAGVIVINLFSGSVTH